MIKLINYKIIMAEILFQYEGQNITIQCNKNQKMFDTCNILANKIKINIESLIFLYEDNQINLDKIYNEITKENKINIFVKKKEDEYCPKCGRILNDKIIDEILSLNKNVNSILDRLKSQIDNIINDINNKKDIIYINSQLKNINEIINGMNDDIKKINNQLNQIKYIPNNNINENKIKGDKIKSNNNEIICIYKKQDDEINLLHDYNLDMFLWDDESKKSYLEGKNNINGDNIDIYINDKKIEFNNIYISEEKCDIKVKFIFKKLLTSTCYMFRGCSSLKSIDLSSFKTNNINNMSYMFCYCSILESIDLSSFNTTNVKDMRGMFNGCSSLKSLDLSSFDITNVQYMGNMFYKCSSLKKENIKIKNDAFKLLNELNN